jgi:hypothetical protein
LSFHSGDHFIFHTHFLNLNNTQMMQRQAQEVLENTAAELSAPTQPFLRDQTKEIIGDCLNFYDCS